MTVFKPKQGQCIDCEDGPPKYLTAKRCQFHYWKHRNQIKATERKAKGLDIDKQAQQKALNLWYAVQISKMPDSCENCNAPLIMFAPWVARAYVAHIVPKRNIKSVMIHPMNRVYLCIDCHTNYDNWSEAKVKEMSVLNICIVRFALFVDQVTEEEWHYLPTYLTELSG